MLTVTHGMNTSDAVKPRYPPVTVAGDLVSRFIGLTDRSGFLPVPGPFTEGLSEAQTLSVPYLIKATSAHVRRTGSVRIIGDEAKL